MGIMHTVTNRDVWGHIVKHFRVSLSDDSVEDVKLKRSTLLSIALVCSESTAVAVSELWRSMKTLEPIIYAFNAPPFRVSSPALEHKRDSSSDYWEMVQASDFLTKDVKSRVLDYLSRVQFLHFSVSPSSKERALWQALQVFDWINPLCPNLRGITFTAGKIHPSIIYYLLPFIVPSVRSIRFDSSYTSSDEAAVSMLLGMIQHRNVQISDIVYVGYASRRIVERAFQFPTLRSVKLLITTGTNGFMEASDVNFFRPSTLLTNLCIDLGMFQSTSKIGGWIETLQSLSTLSLQGTATVIIDCLQRRSFAVVHSLTLFLRQPNRVPIVAPNIFTIISAAFPILHSLHVENKENHNVMNASIALSDIHALREKPLRSLVICCLRLSLSLADVTDVAKTWPTLERLSLVPDPRTDFERYCAVQLLSFISLHAPCMTDLDLPLNMSSFTSRPLSARTTVCPLQRLELTHTKNLPSGLEEKFTLAENLITFFPRLNVVVSSADVRELQMIVKSFRRMLSSLPRRGDN